ncbi:hypothetical protein HDU93_005768, partial [Gonapodya sp. JEL0774]
MVQLLLEAGADMYDKSAFGGESVLTRILNNHSEEEPAIIIRLLIERGFDVDFDSGYALSRSSNYGLLNVVE